MYMTTCACAKSSGGAGCAVPRTAMLRRGKNGRTRHLFRNETWQDADALALIQTSEQEEQEGPPMVQVSRGDGNKETFLLVGLDME